MPAPGALTDADRTILASADGLLATCRIAMDGQQIHQALSAIWGVIGDANRYFAAEEPWKLGYYLARRATVLWVTAELVRTSRPSPSRDAGRGREAAHAARRARGPAQLRRDRHPPRRGNAAPHARRRVSACRLGAGCRVGNVVAGTIRRPAMHGPR